MSYRDLKVWCINQTCIKDTARLLEKLPQTLPSKIIADQLLRSLMSVGANLAEGYSSYEGKEYGRYANIALRSAVESDHWFATLKNLFQDFKKEIDLIEASNVEAIKMLKGLIKSIAEKRSNPNPYALNPSPYS